MRAFLGIFLLSISIYAGDSQLQTMMKEYCISCHGPEKQKGKVRFDNIDLLSSPKLVEDIIYVLEEQEMPPRKKKQPPAEMSKAVLNELHSMTFSTASLKRLTREEYTNTVNDIFGTAFDLSDLLPEDSSEHGFNKISKEQKMSPHQVQSYLNTARFIANKILPAKEKEEKVHVFTAEHFRGSKKGDYRDGDRYILSTHYPWRSNLHFSLDKNKGQSKNSKGTLCQVTGLDYKKFIIEDYGTYRYEVKYEVLNSEKDQVIGVNLGDPRFPTNFKKLKRVAAPKNKGFVSFEISLREGAEVSLTFDSATTWSTNTKPQRYKGPKLGFSEIKIIGPLKTKSKLKLIPSKDMNVKAMADRLLKLVLRRELPAKDREDFYMLAEARKNSGASHRETAITILTAVLCSPHFMYKAEADDVLAERLSFLLWNSAPSESLKTQLKNADRTTLGNVLEQMIADPKTERFYEDFTKQWLQTEKVDDIAPDMRVYKSVTPLHVASMQAEGKEFFKEVLTSGLSMENFIESDFIMVNEKLAQHYGLKGVKGNEFRKYKLPENSDRGGLLGQAGFLKLTSGNFETSPILRGVWIIKNLYGEKMEPPTDVVITEPDIRGTTTVREIIEKHQSSENCYRCHAKIDPLGLALENYDVMGKYRKEYKNVEVVNKEKVKFTKAEIDANAVLPNGAKVNDLKSLKAGLLQDKEKIIKGIISKLISYGTGRESSFNDRVYIDDVYKNISSQNFSLKSAIVEIVSHENFVK